MIHLNRFLILWAGALRLLCVSVPAEVPLGRKIKAGAGYRHGFWQTWHRGRIESSATSRPPTKYLRWRNRNTDNTKLVKPEAQCQFFDRALLFAHAVRWIPH